MPAKSTNAPSALQICNLFPSRSTEKDWRLEHAVGAGLLGAPNAALAGPPPAVDLRATWWDIGNQGATGSCVGWATADGVMRYLLAKAGTIKKTDHLSPRFVWMGSKETDTFVNRPETFLEEAGTTLKAAADICRKFGNVLDKTLPFKIATLMTTMDPDAFFIDASTRKAASYVNLGKDAGPWRTWLSTKGPILAGLSVDKTWDNAASTAGKLDTFQPTTVRGGHAVCIVGYTASRFVVRNSWGTGWGDAGFGYASFGYIKDAFFNESYGISL